MATSLWAGKKYGSAYPLLYINSFSRNRRLTVGTLMHHTGTEPYIGILRTYKNMSVVLKSGECLQKRSIQNENNIEHCKGEN